MNPPSEPTRSTPALQAELLFYEALDKSAEARGAWLDHACGGDSALRGEVEALLADHERARGFLSETESLANRVGEGITAIASEQPGTYIGPYKLIEKIGEGGFGTVWVAEQERPVRRRVALKVIKLGMDTKEVLARFDQERQALALMDHPNIAAMFDAGATPLGRPYFVMELVRGMKITDYCDSVRLSTEERLRLFMQVCHAVQHAHQKGIIHRDLKPSNILITLHDGVPVPKVIDFGVAKATREERLTDLTVYTQFQQMIGTPAYMAPEQAEMTGLDADTRSDVYSLGVLLYELLTGRTPFDRERLLKAGCDEMRRMLREEVPPKPSTLVSTMVMNVRTDIAERRGQEGGRLIGLIRGDLDWITMKALEKDRSRRYGTASGLAEDIGRHLANEPVLARPPSTGYRFRRFARRNKATLAAAAAVLAALLSGLGAATWMYLKERTARERAVLAEQSQAAERQKAEQVTRFLRDMLEGVKPSVAIGRDTRLLADIVDQAAARLAAELGNQPAIEAEVSLIIGEVYASLGNTTKALPHVSRALELTEATHGKEHLKYAEVLQASGDLQDGETAERQCREALALKIRCLGESHPDVATSRAWLAMELREQKRYPEAEVLAREALESLKRELGPGHKALNLPLMVLAQAVGWQGRYSESEQLHSESLALLRTHYGENHPDIADRLLNLGQNFVRQERLDKAEQAFRDGLQMGQRVLPINHGAMKTLRTELAHVLMATGRFDEAKALNDAVVEEIKQQPDRQLFDIIEARNSLLMTMAARGENAVGESLAREILALSREQALHTKRAEHQMARSLGNLAATLINLGRKDEAGSALAEMRKFLEDRHEDNARLWFSLQESMAEKYRLLGRHAESALHYRALYERKASKRAHDHEEVLTSMSSLARALTEWSWQDHQSGVEATVDGAALERAREAEQLLRECLTRREKATAPDLRWRIGDVQSRLGAAIMVATVLDGAPDDASRQGRMAEAERYLLDGFKAMEAEPSSGPKYQHHAAERLVRLYDHLNKPAEAETWRRKMEEIEGK